MKKISAIRDRFRSAHPDHHAIVRGMAWVALFVFFGKLAGAAKEMAVAWRYGVSADVDAYLFVLNIVNWPVGVWFSVLSIVLIPLATRIRQVEPEEFSHFRSELLGLSILLGIILAFLAWAGLPVLLGSSWVGLSGSSKAIADNIVPIMALLAPLGVLISLFSTWMLASGRHTNTLLESVPAFVILTAILIIPVGGVQPLVLGTLAGLVFHLIGLAIPLASRGEIGLPRFSYRSPHWPAFLKGFGIMWAGQMLMSFTVIVDQVFAAKFGTGAIATLSYANRILALILGLGAVAASRAMLPVFSRSQALGGEQLKRVAFHWVRIMFAIGVVTIVIAWVLAPWGVRILFERGAFTPQDTQAVSDVFRYGLVQLPFYLSNIVLVSLLASKGRYTAISVAASFNLFLNMGALLVLTPLFGINGIPLATSVMYAATFILLSYIARKI